MKTIKRFAIVSGNTIKGEWRGVVEMKDGETVEAMLDAVHARRVVAWHDYIDAAVVAVEGWSGGADYGIVRSFGDGDRVTSTRGK